MRKGRARDPEREQRWGKLVQEQQRRGIPIRVFCQSKGLAEAAFYYWRRELPRRRQEQASSSAFVELRPTTPVLPGVGLELRWSPERQLLIRPGCDMQLLVQVLKALEAAC